MANLSAAMAPARGDSDSRVCARTGGDRDAAIAQAETIFRRDGMVVLDNLVDPALIARCRDQIMREYPTFDTVDHSRNFGLYPGRHTVPLHMRDALANRALFAPTIVTSLAGRLLGAEFALDSFGLLVSLPGAEDQECHADALLFRETGIDRILPPTAFALALPLVRMDEISGTTAFWRGSHLRPDAKKPADCTPIVEPGSALLWDFRVLHGGLANRSDAPRPVLFGVFCRDWWREPVGAQATRYEKLVIEQRDFDALGPEARRLLGRARIAGGGTGRPQHD